MTNDLLTKYKIEFADSNPEEFAAFLLKDANKTKELVIIALSFLLHPDGGNTPTITIPNLSAIKPQLLTAIGYYPSLSWVEKITLAIKHYGRAATTNEIVDFILGNEPTLNKKKVTIGVSVTLSRTKGRKFAQLDNSGRGYSYDIINPSEPNHKTFQHDKPKAVVSKPVRPYGDGNSLYNPGWSWKDKIKFFIDSKGGLAMTSELTDQIVKFENITDMKHKQKLVSSMSSVLSQNAKEGGMFTRQIVDGLAVYGIRSKE